MPDILGLNCQVTNLNAEESILCSERGDSYRSGGCAGVTEVMLNTKLESYHMVWKCITRRASKLKGGAASKQKQECHISIRLVTIHKKTERVSRP